jgi:tetratricopeptide (TPR) repeat protein
MVFVALGLVGSLVSIPISNPPDQYGTGLHNLFAGLLSLYQQAPTVMYVVTGAVVLLTSWGYYEHRHFQAEDRAAGHEEIRGIAREEARRHHQAGATPPKVAAPRGLPLPPELVGRDAELGQLMTQLRDGESVGVFALEGIGGVGKTALAAVAVAKLAQDAAFPGGAAWIACEGLAGSDGLSEVWVRVAEALGIPGIAEQISEPARRSALTAALAQRSRTLLALDNVEPGLARDVDLATGGRRPGAEVLLEALALPGHTAVLITSRQAILPDRLVPIYLDVLNSEDAAALFASILARDSRPQGSRPTNDDQAHIPAVVAAVGGLPLAITLAATYTAKRGLTLATLQQELAQDGLHARPLTDPQRGVDVRFNRSYGILSSVQQRLFAGLALLVGASFPRAAVLDMAARLATNRLSGPPAEKPEDALDTLVDYALVEALPDERMRLHPLLREYANERLRDWGPTLGDRLGDAMLGYWIGFAAEHPGYEGAHLLEAEAEGLMGALAWAHAHERDRDLLYLTSALLRAWDLRGRRSDEVQMYTWAEEAAERLGERTALRWAIHQLAATYGQLGRVEEARAGYEQALALARELGDKSAEQVELHSLAVLDGQQGRVEEARAGYEQALALARELGDKSAERAAVHGLAVRDSEVGRVEEARAGYEQALALARELGDKVAERAELHELAVLDADQGHLAEARAGYEQALALARELGDKVAEQRELHGLAFLDGEAGRVEEARAGYEQALALARELGDKSAERTELHSLAVLDSWQGRDEEARAGLERALALARELGDKSAERAELHGLAVLDADQGHLAEARVGYEQALALARELGDPAAQSAEFQSLGAQDVRSGDTTRARSELTEALTLARQVQQPGLIAEAAWWLAEVDFEEGENEAACAGFQEALAIYDQQGNPDAEITRERLRTLGCEPEEA